MEVGKKFAWVPLIWLRSTSETILWEGKHLRPRIGEHRRKLFQSQSSCCRCGTKAHNIILTYTGEPMRPDLMIVSKEGTELTVDHIVPKSHGGSNHERNLMILCSKCNQEKSHKTMREFLREDDKAGMIWERLPHIAKDWGYCV